MVNEDMAKWLLKKYRIPTERAVQMREELKTKKEDFDKYLNGLPKNEQDFLVEILVYTFGYLEKK